MENKFEDYLKNTSEVGYVEKIVHSIAYVEGLPGAKPFEMIIFEDGGLGEVLSLTEKYVEVLLLTESKVSAGSRAARTNERLQTPVGEELLGRVVDPLMRPLDGGKAIITKKKTPIDIPPFGIEERDHIKEPLETGVAVVDMVVPVAKGQRELVIGDRASGKSSFLLQTVFDQALKGTICIYAVIGKRRVDVQQVSSFFQSDGLKKNVCVVASFSSDPSGLTYITPFVAMTIAEYFRDKGKDVLLVLDDLTTHAKFYREIMLLAKRFPSRNSYPSDIFYLHSRLLERAGTFKKGSITCLPVAETNLGDLSGYIQTNIMSMTDGHIFFDSNLFDEGIRPAVNPFLSVTRVGHAGQNVLEKSVSRTMSSFLVYHREMKSFVHFGAELTENVTSVLNLGDKLMAFFNQPPNVIVSKNVAILVVAGLWSGIWKTIGTNDVKKQMDAIVAAYNSDVTYQKNVDNFVSNAKDFDSLVNLLKQNHSLLTDKS